MQVEDERAARAIDYPVGLLEDRNDVLLLNIFQTQRLGFVGTFALRGNQRVRSDFQH